MATARPLVANMNGGEASPYLLSRSDVQKYQTLCRTLFNFTPLIQGGVARRSGTRYVADVKDSGVSGWLIPFRFNVIQNYIIEASDYSFRFYANKGRLETGGAPVETVSPYPAAQAPYLDTVQSADVMWLAHGAYPVHTLSRTSSTSFSVGPLTMAGGPFLDQNTNTGVTVYASAQSGSVDIVASQNIFTPSHVGALFELQQKDDALLTPWEASKSFSAGDLVTNDGKVYKALNTATSGNVEPSHDRGTAWDGKGGVQWDYQHARRGSVRFTAFHSANWMTGTVESLLPAAVVSSFNATWRWAFGAFSAQEGYPNAVTLYLDRLTLGKGSTIYGSVSGGYDDFSALNRSGEVVKDMGYSATLSSDQVNVIRWLSPQRSLMAGTAGDEFSISAQTSNDAFGAGNIRATQVSQFGSTDVIKPVRDGGTTFYVDRSGVALMAMYYRFDTDNYESENLNFYADHLLHPGVKQLALTRMPHTVIWALLKDGRLASLTYQRDQGVLGWARHEVAGANGTEAPDRAVVESIASIPDAVGNTDQLWMIVRRQNTDGSTRRSVEVMERPFRYGDDPETAFHVDAGLTLANTPAATLTPAGEVTTAGASVFFTASAGVFAETDVGRFIENRHKSDSDTDPMRCWRTGLVRIDAVTSPTSISGTVISPFPTGNPLAAGQWRLSVTSVTGLGHLEGQTVSVFANGGTQNQKVVTNGGITLDAPSGFVTVGLPFRSIVEPVMRDAGSLIGTAQSALKRIARFSLSLWATVSLKTGSDLKNLVTAEFRTPEDPMDVPPRPFTGYKSFTNEGRFDEEQRVYMVADDPGPCTVLAYIPTMVTHD